MIINVAGFVLTLSQLEEEDGLGYSVHWKCQIPALPLTSWGQGKDKLGNRPLPVTFVGESDDPPSASQQLSLKWICSHLEESLSRIQKACEESWEDCYFWEGNEMTGNEEYFIEGIRIPPNHAPDWGENPRDTSLPALIVVDLEQGWELEHGFYVVLDPANTQADCWTTWDGLSDLGLVKEDDG